MTRRGALLLASAFCLIFQISPGRIAHGAGQTATRDTGLVFHRVTIAASTSGPLPRLSREQVRVWEDGKEQSIDHFEFDGKPASVAIVWGIYSDTLSAEARFAPLVFLESLSQFQASGSINDRLSGLSARQLKDPRFEYFLVEGGSHAQGPPTVSASFSTTVNKLPRVFPKVFGSFDAIYVGLDVLKEAGFPRKALLMIADTIDEDGFRTELYKQYAIRQNVPIYYILAGGSNAGALALQELADVSGGDGYLSSSGGSIDEYARQVAQGLNNQYIVGYRPTNPSTDGKWRQLRVQVEPGSGSMRLRARIRSGYYPSR